MIIYWIINYPNGPKCAPALAESALPTLTWFLNTYFIVIQFQFYYKPTWIETLFFKVYLYDKLRVSVNCRLEIINLKCPHYCLKSCTACLQIFFYWNVNKNYPNGPRWAPALALICLESWFGSSCWRKMGTYWITGWGGKAAASRKNSWLGICW